MSVTPAIASAAATALIGGVAVGGLTVSPNPAVITASGLNPTVILGSLAYTPVPAIITATALIGNVNGGIIPVVASEENTWLVPELTPAWDAGRIDNVFDVPGFDPVWSVEP